MSGYSGLKWDSAQGCVQDRVHINKVPGPKRRLLGSRIPVGQAWILQEKIVLCG